MCFELLVCSRIDPDARVPFGGKAAPLSDTGASIADGITLEFDGMSTAIADAAALFLLEVMVPLCDEQHEPVLVADILHIRQPTFLPVRTLTFANVDLVLRDQFSIHGLAVFALGNPTCHVPPVAVTQV